MQTRLQNRFTRVDVAALLAFAAVWAYYIITVRYGFCTADESFYVTVAERFVHGDRPLVDEWSRSQLSFLLLCLPYKAYVALTGGTDGVILFMRGLFVAFNAAFYWIVYCRLRAYRWLSLIAALLFCAYVPFGIFACNYYTVSVRLLMIACLVLFAEKQRPPSLLIAGVLFACAVICQPGFAFLYFGYCVLVLARTLRAKKGGRFLEDYAFCINTNTWKHLSAGVALCAAVFLGWLLARSGLRNILSSLPYVLLSDSDFDAAGQSGILRLLLRKLSESVHIFGVACVIPAVLTVVLSAAHACGLFRGKRDFVRKLLFGCACTLWMLSCLPMFRGFIAPTENLYTFICAAPMFWFGLVCYLLCAHKNKRLFPFWVVGLVSSVCADVLSDNAMSLGLPIAYIADLVFFVDLVRELRAGTPQKDGADTVSTRRRKRAQTLLVPVRGLSGLACGCFAVWLIACVVSGNTSFLEHNRLDTPFFSAAALCENGPCRSIRCAQMLADEYSDRMQDMDRIRDQQPKNLFVCGLAPDAYLYAHLPYAAFSTYANRQTQSAYLERNILYWKQHPEKLPACIYIPVDNLDNYIGDDDSDAAAFLAWVRDAFDPLCTYTMEEGHGGYILYVSRWDPND